ncbi:hypothetical protein GOP47_0019094 [Adiantum capillus-veneris]|uniref:Glycosyltransferase 61 catalytic domain-containing protein n=1 Tax=Adiantum capillus-veneris TaxID=13818 RepID=A0A9D4UEL7_ADICA|nr:hypothetical protein GOP47_0019094 [Adiantum capillus-veneris]
MAIAKQKCLLAMAASVLMVLNLSYIINLHPPPTSSLSHAHSDPSLRELIRGEEGSQDQASSTRPPSNKSWPSLPSQLPWTPRPKLPLESCEAYFGNGFTQHVPVFPRKSTSPSKKSFPFKSTKVQAKADMPSLQCFYSETLRTSLCEGRNIVMHPGRIYMSLGGEALDSVVGRTDAEELPSFSPGAFEIVVPAGRASDWTISKELLDFILPQGHILDHRLRSLFSSIQTVSSDEINCSQTVKSSTLFITRYEYANLFHTATDWYSAYVASRVLSLAHHPNVIFVDGHCQSPMDDGWEALFSNITYAKSLADSVCFDHAVFTPLGYETAIFKGLNSGIPCKGCTAMELKQADDDRKTARLREFGEMFKSAFGVENRRIKKSLNILFVRRESYLAHPRHSGKPETRLRNEQELFNLMENWARLKSKEFGRLWSTINIVNGTLAHMKMKDQVQAVDDASVILGVHGAGLTHILFARPGTVILELLSPLFPRPHYSHISQWMGLDYQSITMASTAADCQEVLKQLSTILESLAA